MSRPRKRPGRCARCSDATRTGAGGRGLCGPCYSKAQRAGEFLAVLARRGPDVSWMDDAACAEVGGDIWFPPIGGDPRPAKKICRHCEVQVQCLTAALADPPDLFGIRGGLTPRERNRLPVRTGTDAA